MPSETIAAVPKELRVKAPMDSHTLLRQRWKVSLKYVSQST